MVINPQRPVGLEGFAALYGGAEDPIIPTVARDFLSKQWGNTGMGGDPESFFDRLKVGQQQAAISAAPRSHEGFSLAPNKGLAMPGAAPSPAALATRGVRGPAPGGIATLQNEEAAEPLGPLFVDQSAKHQVGIPHGEKILLENTYGGKYGGFNWQSRTGPDSKLHYEGIKPITAGDDLLKNKTFVALASRSPEEARKVYREFIGSDLDTDMAEKSKQRVAADRDIQKDLRSQFLDGKLRKNPAGFLEREVQVPDPNDPTKTTKGWEVANPLIQELNQKHGKQALGVDRPSIFDEVHPEDQGKFIDEFQKKVKSGMGEQEAAKLAATAVRRKTDPTNANKVATMQVAGNSASPGGVAPNEAILNPAALTYARDLIKNGPKSPHEKDYIKRLLAHDLATPMQLRKMGFPDLAQLAATAGVRKAGQQFRQGITEGMQTNVGGLRIMGDEMQQSLGNMIRGVANYPKKTSAFIGGMDTPWGWVDEPTPEDLAVGTQGVTKSPIGVGNRKLPPTESLATLQPQLADSNRSGLDAMLWGR